MRLDGGVLEKQGGGSLDSEAHEPSVLSESFLKLLKARRYRYFTEGQTQF
jgi:hypothetical protein